MTNISAVTASAGSTKTPTITNIICVINAGLMKVRCTMNRGWTLERRIEMSKRFKGRPSPMKGRKHSQETKKFIGLCSTVSRTGVKLSKKHKEALSKARKKLFESGYRSPVLKDSWCYRTLHLWVERKLGKPMCCSNCGDKTKKIYNWANIGHTYQRNTNHWVRLCVKCHRAFDKQQKGLAYSNQ